MAIFYLDPESGNDANDGTTFANRWKTLTSGATAARIAPGDEIRVIANVINNIGPATFWPNSDPDAGKNNGFSIAWTTALAALVDGCNDTWTGTITNVTKTLSTTGVFEGTNNLQIAIASGFTTGKVAYKTLGATLDLSAFQALSYLLTVSSGSGSLNSGVFELWLCSDALGDTPLMQIPITSLPSRSTSTPAYMYAEPGGNLPSGINSISLRALVDPGTITLRLDNIMAVLARSDANHISHGCFITSETNYNTPLGQWERQWYLVNAIHPDGKGVIVRSGANPVGDTNYPLNIRSANFADDAIVALPFLHSYLMTEWALQDSGTRDAPILLTGGWNRTDMSTKTALSIFGSHRRQDGFLNFNSRINWKIENIGIGGYGYTSSGTGVTIMPGMTGAGDYDINLKFVIDGWGSLFSGSPTRSGNIFVGQVSQWRSTLAPAAWSASFDRLRMEIDNGAANSSTALFEAYSAHIPDEKRHFQITNKCEMTSNTTNPYLVGQLNTGTKMRFVNCGDQDDNDFYGSCAGELIFDNCFDENISAVVPTSGGIVRHTNMGRNPKKHKILTAALEWATVLSGDGNWVDPPPGSTTQALRWLNLRTTNYFSPSFPAKLVLGRVLVRAGDPATVSVWVGRFDNEAYPGIGTQAGDLAGVGDTLDWASAALTDPIGFTTITWEQVEVTFTPTQTGLATIYAFAKADDGLSFKELYFCDLTVTQ